jgi:uncharacterized protein YebE (UPF0316 family)
MFNFINLHPVILPIVLFLMRLTDMSIDTLRLMYVVRGRKSLAWVLGFVQSAIAIIAITSVLSNLDNFWNIFGYAGGFATGTLVGMVVEEKLAIGHGNLRIISSHRGNAIADRLRKNGFAVTELSGRGRDGTVSVMDCSVRRRDIRQLRETVLEADHEAFIMAEDMYPLHRGFWRIS